MQKLSKITLLLIKIFCIGLLLQFFLHTLFTYQFGRDGKIWNVIWLWKELVLGVFVLGLVFLLGKKIKEIGRKSFRSQFKRHQIFSFFVFFLLLLGSSAFVSLFVQKVGLGAYILSIKYDLLSFLIFLIGVTIARLLPLKWNLSHRYNKVLKRVLGGSLVRGGIIVLIPSLLKFVGYSRDSFEGTLVSNPPAVYYTQIEQGLPRNQFLFERPISFGFFLIAFWPLFALSYLRKQSRKTQLGWTILWGVIVFSTISRAAIGVWVLQTGVLALLLYPKQMKKLIFWGVIPGILALIFASFQFKSFFAREHSNTGHLKLLLAGLEIGMQKPITGRGAGYSGPASHQLCLHTEGNPRCELIRETNKKYSMPTIGFNPENQYVQIFMEYGILGFLPWLACFLWLLWTSLKLIFNYLNALKQGKKADQKQLSQLVVLIAFGLGLGGLAIEGLVLHSFVDRMIVYPFMLLWGLAYGQKEGLFEEGKKR